MAMLVRGILLILIVSCKGLFLNPKVVSEYSSQRTCLQNSIHILIKSLQWNSIAIIYGTNEAGVISVQVQQQRYNIDTIDTSAALERIHRSLFPDINIIIAVNDTTIAKLIGQIDRHDFISNGTTDYRHHSKILFILKSIPKLSGLTEIVQHLENVAVIFNKCDTSDGGFDIYTLDLRPEGRIFTLVTYKGPNFSNEIFPNLKYGYNNRHILVTTLESKPHILKRMQTGNIIYTGYMFDIWKTIAMKLNISYTVIEPPDKDWGRFVNGHWNGMVAQLLKKEADIIIADLTITYARAQSIDYIYPVVFVDSSDILYRRQPSSTKTFFLLLGPLRTEVYLVFLAVCIATVVLFFLIQHHSALKMFSFCEQLKILWNIFIEFIGTTIKQNFKIPIVNYAGKVLLSSWCFLVLLFTSVYSANLIAALSSQTDLSKLSSIDELVDSDYTVGMPPAGIRYTVMKSSKRLPQQRLFAKMVEASEYDSRIFDYDEDAQVARVQNSMHAYITYKATAAVYMTKDCHLALIGEPVTWANELLSFAVPKGSPLNLDIEQTMYSLKETGILDILWKKWTSGNNASSCAFDKQVTAITMREVTGGFLVVCGGIGLSFVILVVEMCHRRVVNQLCDKLIFILLPGISDLTGLADLIQHLENVAAIVNNCRKNKALKRMKGITLATDNCVSHCQLTEKMISA